MSKSHQCLCLGLDPSTLGLGPSARLRGAELALTAAFSPEEVRQAFDDPERWDLVLCAAASWFDLGVDRWLQETEDALCASLILIRPANSALSPAEALARGGADLITHGDREHLRMAMVRELRTAELRRELHARGRAEIAPPAERVFSVPKILGFSPPGVGADALPAELAGLGHKDLEQRIKGLIEGGGLTLEYQPIIPLKRAVGEQPMFEVLLRLRDDCGTLLRPQTFFPVAERRHWLAKLDQWVLRRTLPMLGQMQRAGHPGTRLFVNLTNEALATRTTLQAIITAVAAAEIDPETLVLEVPREAFFQQTAALARLAKALKEQRQCLLVERLGGDDCALIQGNAEWIDYCKLDRTLLLREVRQALRPGGRPAEGLDRLVRCAANHGVQVIALAIEEAALVPHIYHLGVDYLQGHFISRPYADMVYPGLYQLRVDGASAAVHAREG